MLNIKHFIFCIAIEEITNTTYVSFIHSPTRLLHRAEMSFVCGLSIGWYPCFATEGNNIP